jgi:Ca-activated chloride channel family protein
VKPRVSQTARRQTSSAPPAGGRTLRRLVVLLGWVVAVLAAGFAYPVLARGHALLAARWEAKWLLLGLLVVPVVFWRATFGEDRRVPRLRLGTIAPLKTGPVGWRVWLRDLPGILRSVALGLFVLALARPVDTLRPQSNEEEGIDMVLVLDLSGSMQAVMENLPQDLRRYVTMEPGQVVLTRLDAAKAVIRDFIARRQSDRIGVVVFGTEAYVLSPPTLDYHLLDTLVSRMRLKLIDGNATAIGDAVGVAVARLRRSTAPSKAVVLLTDGDNNAGKISPEYAATLANTVHARLFTIQIGSGEMAKVQTGVDLFGQPTFAMHPYPVNPKLLKELASTTGGEAYVATDARALEASFHDVLNRLEKTKFEASTATYEELFPYFLLPGVLLVALDALVRSLLLRRFP